MPHHATPTSYGQPRANKGGDPRAAGAVGTEIALIRRRCRIKLAKSIERLGQIADGSAVATVVVGSGEARGVADVGPAFGDQIHAADVLARYGVGTVQAVDVTSGGLPLTDAERSARLAALVSAIAERA